MVICHLHNDDPDFIFCVCNKSMNNRKRDEDKITWVGCKTCSRWLHQQCVKIKDLEKDFECQGCKENNLFYKAVGLPELIQKMGEIQIKKKLDKHFVKILDSFVFRLSELILQICKQKKYMF